MIKENKALICTGFHRSATSALANYLINAGLNFGNNLMPGGVSNPKGHFEDRRVVDIHNKQLQKSQTNWQFHDECDLQSDKNFLAAFIEHKNSQFTYWGVKDPRACLFLDDWETALGKSGCFLFVVRHWSSCIESLLHRHSRALAFDLPKLNEQESDLQFWKKPHLAANMWLSYCSRMLAFVKKHPNKVVTVTQRALFQNAPVLQTLNNKFALNLNEQAPLPFESNLFRDKANKRILKNLSASYIAKLDAVWQELLSLATLKTQDETPIFFEEQLEQYALSDIYGRIKQSSNDLLGNIIKSEDKNIDTSILPKATTSAEGVIKVLDSIQFKNISNTQLNMLIQVIDKNFPTEGKVLLSLAKLLVRAKEYERALDYFQKTVALGVYYPFVDSLMAQCYQALSLFELSEYHYNKAIEANPRQPNFYINYAKLLVLLMQTEKAEQQFQFALAINDKQASIVANFAEFLISIKKIDKAILLLEGFLENEADKRLEGILIQAHLIKDITKGRFLYHQQVKKRLSKESCDSFLVRACHGIDDAMAEQDLIIRCTSHWRKL